MRLGDNINIFVEHIVVTDLKKDTYDRKSSSQIDIQAVTDDKEDAQENTPGREKLDTNGPAQANYPSNKILVVTLLVDTETEDGSDYGDGHRCDKL
jgi:hypothetical protein